MITRLGCIADDYTGASDLANTLTKCGLRTVQTIGIPADSFSLPDVSVVVVSLKIRSIAATEAVAQARADGGSAGNYRLEVDKSDLRAALPREHANQIGVAHRIEGMILERTFIERDRADEQIALIDGARGFGKRRRDHGDGFAGVGAQRIKHRPDVALVG